MQLVSIDDQNANERERERERERKPIEDFYDSVERCVLAHLSR